MEAYQASMKDSKTGVLDLRGKYSWDDVLRLPRDAEVAYIAAGGNKLRKAARFSSTKAEVIQPYLGLIPNDFFLSILCGGLKLVLGAAASVGEKRDLVFKTLWRIPEVIFQAERSVETFPLDPLLYDKAADVYLAALVAIEGTTKWLMRHSALKSIRAVFLGPLYSKSFSEKIQALEEALGTLEERVSVLRDGCLVRTEKTVNKVEEVGVTVDVTTKATLHHVHDLKSEVKYLGVSASRTNTKVSSITGEIKSISKSQDETNMKIEHLEDLQQAKEEAKRAMMVVLEETTKTAKWMKKKDRDIRRLKMQIEILERAAAALTPYDLLDVLGASAETQTRDIERVFRASQLSELSASYSVKSIFESEKFKEWQATDTSIALYIEDSLSSSSFGRITTLSLISSAVIEHFHDKDPAVLISFFCGLHTTSRDALKGPEGLMRSLISQILRLFSMNLDFISSRRYREQLQSFHIHTLCDCFTKLVKRLPFDTVLFCVIDGMSSFERKEWAEGFRTVANCLIDLTEDAEPGPIFKLLISSSSRSRYIRGVLPSEFCLSLPDGQTNYRGGPMEREISARTRQPARMRRSELLHSTGVDKRLRDGLGTLSDSFSESETEPESGKE